MKFYYQVHWKLRVKFHDGSMRYNLYLLKVYPIFTVALRKLIRRLSETI